MNHRTRYLNNWGLYVPQFSLDKMSPIFYMLSSYKEWNFQHKVMMMKLKFFGCCFFRVTLTANLGIDPEIRVAKLTNNNKNKNNPWSHSVSHKSQANVYYQFPFPPISQYQRFSGDGRSRYLYLYIFEVFNNASLALAPLEPAGKCAPGCKYTAL